MSPCASNQIRSSTYISPQNFHAKVFVLGQTAFVGSANASRNSSRYLVEAAIAVGDVQIVEAARAFVESLMITELDEPSLRNLEAIYRPSPPPQFPRRQAPDTTLIMQLTLEQGVGRGPDARKVTPHGTRISKAP